MERYAREKFDSCPEILENFHDAFSLVEQVICQKSKIFYFSHGSRSVLHTRLDWSLVTRLMINVFSWSLNVQMERDVQSSKFFPKPKWKVEKFKKSKWKVEWSGKFCA